MIKEKMYTYIGVNGSLTTSILLEGINHTLTYKITAEKGKKLYNKDTKETRKFVYAISDDVSDWQEVADEDN